MQYTDGPWGGPILVWKNAYFQQNNLSITGKKKKRFWTFLLLLEEWGWGLAVERHGEKRRRHRTVLRFRGSDPECHLWLTVLSLSFLPCVLVGKPSSFFPEDSFIDSGEIDVGRRASQKIPPGTFWRSQVFIDHPVHLKFNVSLGKAALVGIYGRKGLPPSHTQVIRTPHLLLTLGSCPAS